MNVCYMMICSWDDLILVIVEIGLFMVLKSVFGGYDGKG